VFVSPFNRFVDEEAVGSIGASRTRKDGTLGRRHSARVRMAQR
jgi:hypothetical protein